ncbi:Formyl transferase [Acetoanaerobium noterae]|uniref:Formyl transferase n=1 Tax=Acetoanaerobium noterae TaxID=745369 RepID=A0A1T5AZL7_9FIRM|nr:dTDP-4-amino-4,6-dideoxyglucose formyltransferase [Acetoanaerobium noterae]SKB40415.1 Formyl transferase [Acetoanaerobium noterae]
MNILILTDNEFLYISFKKLIMGCDFEGIKFDYFYSYNNEFLQKKCINNFKAINLKKKCDVIIENYDLVFSLHCKQLFPPELVKSVRCVNVHPGLNPHNRGWFPQVFSIINKLPIGVTIHEMDEELDHGPIIVQKELEIRAWETSYDVYQRIQELEIELIRENLLKIINNEYKAVQPNSEGNVNLKKDFNELCEIDLDKKVSYREAIDFFRSMSFKGYKNAYFHDEEGNKIFVEIELEKEE